MYYVYGLTTTEHDKLIYIGASRDPQKRLYEHIISRGQQYSPLQKRLYNKHDDIGYVVLSECNDWRMALDKERELIELYFDMGHPLLNKFHTPPYKQELIDARQARKEYYNSPEQVEFRAGMGRVLSIWGKCRFYKISHKQLFKLFPLFKDASQKFYINKDQHDMICRELPILLQQP